MDEWNKNWKNCEKQTQAHTVVQLDQTVWEAEGAAGIGMNVWQSGVKRPTQQTKTRCSLKTEHWTNASKTQ